MSISTKPSRLILGYRGSNYKFLNFFVDKKDNSFYFHVYRKHGETPMKRIDGDAEEKKLNIRFDAFEPTGFPENKISFHESGYIHSTDPHGRRYRDGVIGIPFARVDSILYFLVVAPRNPVEMIELRKIDEAGDIHLNLPDDVQPFAVHFAIVRKGVRTIPRIAPDENMLGGHILCEYHDKDFGLLMTMVKVVKGPAVKEVAWPPFPVVIKRLA